MHLFRLFYSTDYTGLLMDAVTKLGGDLFSVLTGDISLSDFINDINKYIEKFFNCFVPAQSALLLPFVGEWVSWCVTWIAEYLKDWPLLQYLIPLLIGTADIGK